PRPGHYRVPGPRHAAGALPTCLSCFELVDGCSATAVPPGPKRDHSHPHPAEPARTLTRRRPRIRFGGGARTVRPCCPDDRDHLHTRTPATTTAEVTLRATQVQLRLTPR